MLQTSLIDMEWNTKWEWENLDIFSSKEISSPKKLQSTEDIDTSFNISEYRNSSAKNSISESSLKDVMKGGSSSSFPSLETSVCSNSDQSVGLKLGKRTYFENNLPQNNTKTSSSSNINVSYVVKKVKLSSSQNTPIPRCQVEGCNLDLSSAKEYHRKHRVCESHSKSLEVVVGGLERRFCQQCSRFHGLLEFDGKKRSCRKRLSDHNARRRKPHEKSIQFNSRNRSSSFYDEREELIYVFGNQTKHGEHNGVNHSFGIQFQNDVSMPAIAFNRMTSSKGTLAGVFDQGSNAEGLDLRRALSLLSNDSRGSCEPNYNIALNQPMRTNGPTMAQDAVHSAHHGLPVSSPDFWRVDHQSIDPHTHFQESHIFKAPYGIHYGNPMDEILKPM